MRVAEAPSRARQFVRAGDTLFSGVRINLRRTVLVKPDVTDVASTAFSVLSPGNEIDPGYLFRWMTSDFLVNSLIPLQRGSQPPAVLDDDVRAQPIAVPPLEVQRRIVTRINELFDEIDDGEAALARACEDLTTWRNALLRAAVTGELTADWRGANAPAESGTDLLARLLIERRGQWAAVARNRGKKYNDPAKPDLELLGRRPTLPRDWTWASAAQLTTLVTSGSRGWAEYYSDAGATFIRAQNINSDKLRLDGIAYVMPPRGSEGARTKVSKDDILVTITGANVTKSALVNIEFEEAYVSQHVGLMRPTDTSMSAFLYWWIVTPAGGRAILEREAYGAGKPGLNLPNLSGLPVPLPPLDEQREIARICASADVERIVCADAMVEAQQVATTLRQSILAAAFRGDLA